MYKRTVKKEDDVARWTKQWTELTESMLSEVRPTVLLEIAPFSFFGARRLMSSFINV